MSATTTPTITRTSPAFWQAAGIGLWDGPTTTLTTDEVTVTLRALYVAGDGVTVTLDSHDSPIPAGMVDAVASELKALAATTPPTTTPRS